MPFLTLFQFVNESNYHATCRHHLFYITNASFRLRAAARPPTRASPYALRDGGNIGSFPHRGRSRAQRSALHFLAF